MQRGPTGTPCVGVRCCALLTCLCTQPTVVDPATFLIWKDEAFALWTSQWQSIYGKQQTPRDAKRDTLTDARTAHDSPQAALIASIVDNFYLVNIVDNNYVDVRVTLRYVACAHAASREISSTYFKRCAPQLLTEPFLNALLALPSIPF